MVAGSTAFSRSKKLAESKAQKKGFSLQGKIFVSDKVLGRRAGEKQTKFSGTRNIALEMKNKETENKKPFENKVHPQYGTHFKTLPNGMLVRITESEVRPIAGYDQKENSGRIYITREGKKGEEVVGFTEYHPGKLMGVGDVTLYSEHEKHREEINRAVHEAAEKLAKKHGSEEILVTVPVKTVPVHEHEGKLLEANGFKPRRELDGHVDYYVKNVKQRAKR